MSEKYVNGNLVYRTTASAMLADNLPYADNITDEQLIKLSGPVVVIINSAGLVLAIIDSNMNILGDKELGINYSDYGE